MIYKFKCKASGDVIMLGANGDQLLRLLGREPSTQGIIEPDAMPEAIAALKAAAAADEAGRSGADDDEAADDKPGAISLRRRLWPMIEMLERASRAREPVVWGV